MVLNIFAYKNMSRRIFAVDMATAKADPFGMTMRGTVNNNGKSKADILRAQELWVSIRGERTLRG
jgi:hypothetical protein